jgi:transposase
VVTTEGYPVGYEVFDGNTADSTTVQEIVEKVEAEHGKSGRIWVMDRGNVSEANLAFLRRRGGRYIVGTPKALLRQVRGQITDQGWREVREGIKVKTVTCPDGKLDGAETLILCRSDDRIEKESAMLDRFVKRMEEGLEAMKKSAENRRLTDILAAHVRLGRLVDKNWRAAECFTVKIEEKDGGLCVNWTKDEQKKRELCGCYLLRTNLPEADPVILWQQYIQLTDAEWAFRISKDELELRPIWHRHADRVKAHILVCFIAYAMWKTLSGWMKSSGLGEAPRPLVEELANIMSGDVLLPTRSVEGGAGPTLVVRCVTRPDEHQSALLDRLGLRMPNQIKRFRVDQGVMAPS